MCQISTFDKKKNYYLVTWKKYDFWYESDEVHTDNAMFGRYTFHYFIKQVDNDIDFKQ